MATTTQRNGVDVERLVQTIDAIKEDANLARFTFRTTTSWESGSTSRAEIASFAHAGSEAAHARTHVLVGSEPEVLLGGDRGPNAVELVLAALGFCYSVGFVYNAAALGIELDELSYEVEGDLDLRRFVGIEEGPRAGFTEIRVKGRVRARNATREQLEELCRYVQATSPVGDVLQNPVPVRVSLEVR
ncbi:MAG TPA: OsmC family protein [Actinomycetota bacterium]|nr:OsmC family protein [Actinomycetota bacterium]